MILCIVHQKLNVSIFSWSNLFQSINLFVIIACSCMKVNAASAAQQQNVWISRMQMKVIHIIERFMPLIKMSLNKTCVLFFVGFFFSPFFDAKYSILYNNKRNIHRVGEKHFQYKKSILFYVRTYWCHMSKRIFRFDLTFMFYD